MKKSFRKLALFVAMGLVLGACGKSSKDSGQTAAVVNGEEISIGLVNRALSGVSGISPESAPQLRKEVLDGLITQQLAINQATAQKLDRTPEVVLAVEMARREIIARAYQETIAKALPKPTQDQAKKYYQDHPELFAQRRVYGLQDIVISKQAQGITAAELGGKSLEEVVALLQSRKIPFSPNVGSKGAEEIALDLIGPISKVTDTAVHVLEVEGGIHVFRVLGSRAEPVAEEAALPRILQYLANRQTAEAVQKDIAQSREKARIEFKGEFAANTAATQPSAPVAKSAEATSAGNAVDKGVAGLK